MANNTQTWAYRRAHTRGSAAFASYGLAGSKGIAFANSSLLAQGATWPATLAVTPNAPAGPATLTLAGSAVQGTRYNYTLAGVPGVLQVAAAFFAGPAPTTLGVAGVALATPRVSAKAAQATSAVVAAANVAQATAKAQPVATPPAVAAVVAQGAAVVVAQAKAQAPAKGAKGAKGAKAHAAKVG